MTSTRLIAIRISGAVRAALVGLIVVATTASAQTPPAEAQTTGKGKVLKPIFALVKVRADGTVDAVRPEPGAPAAISAKLASGIAAWKFRPARRDGVPVDWVTRMTVVLIAVPSGEGFELKVGGASVSNVVLSDEWSPGFIAFTPLMRKKGLVDVFLLWKPGHGGVKSRLLSVGANDEPMGTMQPFFIDFSKVVKDWRIVPVRWDDREYPPLQVCTATRYYFGKPEDLHQPTFDIEGPTSVCRNLPSFDADAEIALTGDPTGTMLR
jgi:hypothetical protein